MLDVGRKLRDECNIPHNKYQYIYIYIYIYIHICICTHVHIHIYMYTYMLSALYILKVCLNKVFYIIKA